MEKMSDFVFYMLGMTYGDVCSYVIANDLRDFEAGITELYLKHNGP